MTTSNVETDVLIVGAGPVGLALALDLGWRGVSCMVVEQSGGEVQQPRMDLVGIRSMEFCRRWGIVEDVENAGYPRHQQQDIVYVNAVAGYEFGREIRPAMADERPPPFSPQKRERCPQNYFDPVLRRAAERYDCVSLKYFSKLVSFTEQTNGVLAEVENVGDQSRFFVKAAYIVGCDGATSAVRRHLDIDMHGEALLTNSTNVLLRYDRMAALSGRAQAYRYVLIDEQGLWATLVAINGKDVWRLQIVGAPNLPPLEDSAVEAAINKALGIDQGYDVLSIMNWRRRELVASHFRSGRAFLVGDSAHQMSPTGGFGMNTGLGEAVDIGWKLEAALAGWGGALLLDSYDADRRPIAERNVREASENLGRMMAIAGDPAIGQPGAEADRIRQRVGAAASAAMQREWNAIGIHIGYRYDASPLSWPDGTPQPEIAVTSYEPMARPGARAPHAWLSSGVSTLDLFGRGYALLQFAGDTQDCAGIIAAAQQQRVPLRYEHLPQAGLRELYGARFALVRPDGHVAWRADTPPVNPAALIEVVRGNGRAS